MSIKYPPFEVDFDNPKLLRIIPELQVTMTKLLVRKFIDNPIDKTVIAVTDKGNVLLWEGDTYDEIGDWTKDDVVSKINEIYEDASP